MGFEETTLVVVKRVEAARRKSVREEICVEVLETDCMSRNCSSVLY